MATIPNGFTLSYAGYIKSDGSGPYVMDSNGNMSLMSAGSTQVTASASFMPAAAAYSAGDILDVAKEFAWTFTRGGGAIPAGSTVRVTTSLLKIDQAAILSGETSYTLQNYAITPPSAQADNAAWTLASADLAAYRGLFSIGTPIDLGTSCFIKLSGLSEDINLSSSSHWSELVTVGGATFTAVARQVTLFGVLI